MITVAGETFKDKKALLAFIHQLLHKSPVNRVFTDKSARVIGHLLTYHPEYKQKTGSGVRALCIGIHKASGARAYSVVTNEGKKETFSIRKCVKAWEQHIPKQENEKRVKNENRSPQVLVPKPKQETTQHRQQETTTQRQTQREKILTFLKDTPKQRKDIIQHICGPAAQKWQTKYIGNLLSSLVKKGEVHRIKTGVYALGSGIPKKTLKQLRTDIKNALQTGEKKRADIIQAVYGDTVPDTHTQYMQTVLKSMCDSKHIIKIRHGVYASLNGTDKKNSDIHQRIGRIKAQLATCLNELQNIQEQIQTEKKNEH